jgi:hypothetical protein
MVASPWVQRSIPLLAEALQRRGTLSWRSSHRRAAPLVLVLILRLYTTLFDATSHFAKYKDRSLGQPLLLLGVEGLIERLLRIGEPLEVGCSFGQGFGSSTQEVDGITLTQDFDSREGRGADGFRGPESANFGHAAIRNPAAIVFADRQSIFAQYVFQS